MKLEPYLSRWRPNSVQRQFLKRYEKRLLREGKSRAEANRLRLKLTADLERDAMWGTPSEQEIRQAIYADGRALRYLRFFIDGPGAEWAMIIRLSMWAHAEDQDPSTKESLRNLLIPRDQVLSFLRERGRRGTTHRELVRTWPSYGTGITELRDRGFAIDGVPIKTAEGEDDFRFVLTRDVKRHKLVKQQEEFARIAKAIEDLGSPAPLREAHDYAGTLSRSRRHYERSLQLSPLAYRWKGLLEDDIIRVAAGHLKRVTYLMAIAQRTVWHSAQSVDDIGTVLFERLNKRVQRSAKK
jgi:hypothetical protein